MKSHEAVPEQEVKVEPINIQNDTVNDITHTAWTGDDGHNLKTNYSLERGVLGEKEEEQIEVGGESTEVRITKDERTSSKPVSDDKKDKIVSFKIDPVWVQESNSILDYSEISMPNKTESSSLMKRHNTTVHEDKAKNNRYMLKCEVCPFSSVKRSSLKKHVQAVHKKIKRSCVEEQAELFNVASGGSKKPRVHSGGLYCAAVGCHHCTKRDGPKGIYFYRFPADQERRQRWLSRVSRLDNGAPWKPNSNSRLCSAHFVNGKKSDDPQDIDYVPSVFLTAHVNVPNNPAHVERAKL